MSLRLPPESAPSAPPGTGATLARGESLRLNLTDVTGFNRIVEDVPRATTVGALARSMVDRWSLPGDTPWGLRRDDGLALEEDLAVGEQIAGDEATLTLQPKAHLG